MQIVNIDTLELSFDVYDYAFAVEKYIDALETAKHTAAEMTYNGMEDKSYIEIGEITFEVMRNGKHGYAYILHNDDIELDIAKYRSSKQEFYPIRVRFKAKYLWEQGMMAYTYIAQFIRDHFNDFGSTKVSRVDLACHTDAIEPKLSDWDDFYGRFNKDQAIRNYRKVETFYFGSRTTQKCYCRIYNKTNKCIIDKDNQWFFDIWEDNDLNLMNVWNVEFELKRELLKEMKIETYEDLVRNIQSIWIYLTSDWITWRINDDSNITRRTLKPEWIEIQAAYRDFEFNGFITRARQREVDTSKYIPSVAGYISSICASMNIHQLESGLNFIRSSVKEYLKDKKSMTFKDVVTEKSKKYSKRDLENLELIGKMKYAVGQVNELDDFEKLGE